MNYDLYGEVINGESTYKRIAKELKEGLSVGIAWSDEDFTHYDIIFNLSLNVKAGYFQRGLKQDYLYISIIDYTSYGFSPYEEKHPEYIKEKIRLTNISGDKIAELINGIIRELNKEE